MIVVLFAFLVRAHTRVALPGTGSKPQPDELQNGSVHHVVFSTKHVQFASPPIILHVTTINTIFNSPYSLNYSPTLFAITRFPALYKTPLAQEKIIPLSSILIRPNHIGMPNPTFPLWSPDFPHRSRNRANQLSWSLPEWLELVFQCLSLGVPQPYPVPCLECPLDPSPPSSVVGSLILQACMSIQPIPHHR